MVAPRPSLQELREECAKRGLSTRGCLERGDLEALLQSAPRHEGLVRPADPGKLRAALEELGSWVSYAPRAVALLQELLQQAIPAAEATSCSGTVSRYLSHPEPGVSAAAAKLLSHWNLGPSTGSSSSSGTARRLRLRRPAAASDDDSDCMLSTLASAPAAAAESSSSEEESDSSSSSESLTTPAPKRKAAAAGKQPKAAGKPASRKAATVQGTGQAAGGKRAGWEESVRESEFRGRKERFRKFILHQPFRCATLAVHLRLAESQFEEKPKSKGKKKSQGAKGAEDLLKECRELLERMAVDFGALSHAEGGLSAMTPEERQVLERLRRLEERFRGNGVTEGEARNAVRLFERELSKANWTEEKFLKLKKQLAGEEDWTAADLIVECSVRWESSKRRQAWFSDACERVAVPLGLQSGYLAGAGVNACSFVGPLACALGAALTVSLVCHFAFLDLERALKSPCLSRPQFLQGFVDGALSVKRHLIWEKLFSIEDEKEAAQLCREHVSQGFFDEDNDEENQADEHGDLQDMLRRLFAAQSGSGATWLGGTSSSSSRPGRQPDPAAHQAPAARAPADGPPGFTPFSGKACKLSEEKEEASCKTSAPSPPCRSGPPPAESHSWAITFSSNLELARTVRRKSTAEAKRLYHWSSSGTALKATKKDTASYSKGKQAGEKRKGDIDSAASAAKKKFRRGPQKALTG